jgi:hypothetical protein
MPKRKTRPPTQSRRSRAPDHFDLIDEAVSARRANEVSARLMNMAGSTDDLPDAAATETGWMIASHAQKLHRTLRSLKERPSQ